jgi:hypothetical protein
VIDVNNTSTDMRQNALKSKQATELNKAKDYLKSAFFKSVDNAMAECSSLLLSLMSLKSLSFDDEIDGIMEEANKAYELLGDVSIRRMEVIGENNQG